MPTDFQQYGIPEIQHKDLNPDKFPTVYRQQTWLKQFILPFKQDKKHLHIAIGDIHQITLLDALEQQQALKIYHANPELLKNICNKILNKEKTSNTQTQQLTENLLQDAIRLNASDIHIECDTEKTHVRLRIDGLLYPHIQFDKTQHTYLISHLKILANLDIAQRRLPQDGRFHYSDTIHQRDCRVSFIPTLHGEKCVIRLLNAQQLVRRFNELGLEAEQIDLLKKHLHQPQGLILVTGPTGSGKTQTLYTALDYLNKPTRNITSIEDPIEIDLPGINQVNTQPLIGLDFSKSLRAFLRQDPDIIMVGEIRDLETANIALRAAHTGHLVLATLHTRSAYQSILRLLNMGIAPYQLAHSLNLIIAQRLLRRTCQHCDATGCDFCQQGYQGRTGVFECLAMTANLRQTIIQQSTLIEEESLYQKQKNLWQQGQYKVQKNQTDLRELYRVLSTEMNNEATPLSLDRH